MYVHGKTSHLCPCNLVPNPQSNPLPLTQQKSKIIFACSPTLATGRLLAKSALSSGRCASRKPFRPMGERVEGADVTALQFCPTRAAPAQAGGQERRQLNLPQLPWRRRRRQSGERGAAPPCANLQSANRLDALLQQLPKQL